MAMPRAPGYFLGGQQKENQTRRMIRLNNQSQVCMRISYAVSRVLASSLSPRLGIACAAISLVLGGCSTYEAGTPKAAVNYREPSAAKTENHVRSLEQVIKDQHDWYQTFE
jgi:hypothetical protein